jgi:exonuclease III
LETHLNEDLFVNEVKKIFMNYSYFIPTLETSYKGVGILIKNNNKTDQIRHEIIDPNRLIITEIKINDSLISFVNNYSPNLANEHMDFINLLDDTLIHKKNIIVIGDFNHNISDKNKNTFITKQWNEFYKNLSLKEFKFNEKINESTVTWSNENTATRIDRIYYSNNLKEKFDLQYNNILINIYSDHKIVIADIVVKNVENLKIKPNFDNWKLNDTILNDEIVISRMKDLCEEIGEYFDENNPSWYDFFINKVRRMLIHESIRIKKENERYINEISLELNEWYEESKQNRNEELDL